MSDFKAGQKVWSTSYGWGKVIDSPEHAGEQYSICVKFDDVNEDQYFTEDGKYWDEEKRTLFFKEIIIPADALVPPKMEIILNQGDIVLFENGELGYVEKYSGSAQDIFHYHLRVPQKLDDAFDTKTSKKKFIKKVVGNINAI